MQVPTRIGPACSRPRSLAQQGVGAEEAGRAGQLQTVQARPEAEEQLDGNRPDSPAELVPDHQPT